MTSISSVEKLIFRENPVTLDFRAYGLRLVVPNGVFAPLTSISHSTEALFPVAYQTKGLRVLDIGTGSGVLAVLAAKGGAREVFASDISSVAVETARRNALLNKVEDVCTFAVSDLFSHVPAKKFDVIFANLPIEENVWENVDIPALQENLFREVSGFLADNGRIHFVSATFGDLEGLEKRIASHNLWRKRTKVEKCGLTWYKYKLGLKGPSL